MANIITFLKKKDLYLGITRYGLALVMVSYAVTKILRTQFILIPAASWARPLETLSGRGLAWAFLGYSPWFQVLLGFLELIPSILLLFRRTTLAGAILLLPMTLNVCLINHALNLWDATKTISIILLLLNILVLIFEWARIKAIFLIIIDKGKTFKLFGIEAAINFVVLAVVIYLSSGFLLNYIKQTDELTGDWYNRRPVEWKLITDKNKDTTSAVHDQRMYFGAFGEVSQLNDTGYVAKGHYSYELDKKKHILKFFGEDKKLMRVFNYTIAGNSVLRLEVNAASPVKDQPVQLFRKRIIYAGAK